MNVPSKIAGEMYQRFARIKQLAKEVEAIPNFGPDVWSMKEGDKKCQQICEDAVWLEQIVRGYIGTGDGSISEGSTGTGGSSGTGAGGFSSW